MGLLFFIIICLQLLSHTPGLSAESCEGRCGEQLIGCSCKWACLGLQDCCEDVKQFCVDTTPHSGSLLGGADFKLLNTNYTPDTNLTCRFMNEVITSGYIGSDGSGHCVAPQIFLTGWIWFDVSTDGLTYTRSGRWLSVHHSKLAAGSKAVLVNGSQWQYYGMAGVGGALRMEWNRKLINSERVNVELWGYRETGEQYTEQWAAGWMFLETLARDVPNSGSFSFTPKPSWSSSVWHVGSVRVSTSSSPAGARNVVAVWSSVHALAYYLGEEFRKDPPTWALQRCLEWERQETQIPNFLSELPDCPCTLSQARADTGRFHTDYGCDIEKGSVCTYHPGAVHCVRAIQASPVYGAGQQCCYDSSGSQVLTGDSVGGSTPDRGHDWGAPPYLRPPRVPGLSHWTYDVLSFYYCCLWSDHCPVYLTHRPSSDCRTYRPPRAASVLGDPHFLTFDGLSFTFNGKGEYTLLTSPAHNLTLQIRTQPISSHNGSVVMATRLCSVAMQERDSDVIEVRLSDWPDRLQVLMNQQEINFSEQDWMDLKGVFVYSQVSQQGVTVMFSSGVGVEVRGQAGVMTLTVLLPEHFSGLTQGLLGNMNSDPEDDLTSSDGTVIPADSSPEDVFNYGAGWQIKNESSLFTYDSALLLSQYYFSPKHDPEFVPVFWAPEDEADPLLESVVSLCSGEGGGFCKFDSLVSRSLELGNATLLAHHRHVSVTRDLQPVVSCGWLKPPLHGQKEGTRYLAGSKVSFSCNHGYRLHGDQERVCQSDGRWSGDQTHCVSGSGSGSGRVELPEDLHLHGRVQSDLETFNSEHSYNVLSIVLGSVGAILALVAMVVAVVTYNRKQKRERMNEREDKVHYQPHTVHL